jgi:hypothetical protein
LLAGMGIFGLLNWALWVNRARPAWNDLEWRRLRWLMASAVAACIPVTASIPADRHLIVSSIAGAGVVASVLRALWEQRAFVARGAKVVLIVTQGLVVLPAWIIGPWWFASTARYVENGVAELSMPVESHVVIPVAPDPFVALCTIPYRALQGFPMTASWSVLSFAPHTHRLTRTGEQTYELEIVGGRMLETVFEQLFRDPRKPLQVGEVSPLDALTVTVLDVVDGRPSRLRIDAREPLVFVRWRDSRFERFEPPPIGSTLELPYQSGPFEQLMRLVR